MYEGSPVAETAGGAPELSVVVCTRNPREDLFRRVLASLAGQTLPRERWELVLVDNGSVPALEVGKLDPEGRLPLRLVAEPVAGLTVARRKGIAEARAGLLAFVDDDNFLDPDYLENAVRIARENPGIGHFGGVARAEFEGGEVAAWKQELLGHLGIRDHGAEVITKQSMEWGPWEPIGAGMVSRRAVAERWAEVTKTNPDAAMLGRAGTALLSGEDGLFARVACQLGFACSYQPSLKLTHYMKRGRLSARYLARLIEGHGRSHVLLKRATGENPPGLTWRQLYKRLRFRIRKKGWRLGVVTFYWDMGYRAQANTPWTPGAGVAGQGPAKQQQERSVATA